jgi:hypothetical protein
MRPDREDPDWGRALQQVVLDGEAVVLRKTNGWIRLGSGAQDH